MITPLEAWELVQTMTQEHFADGEGGSGISKVMADLGISEEQLLDAIPDVFYKQTMVQMPVPSQTLGAFVAGALWRSRAEAPPVVTGEMIERAAQHIAEQGPELGDGLPDDFAPTLASVQRDIAREILRAALSPAAGPPTDDGAGGSS